MPKSKVEVKKPHIDDSRNRPPAGMNETSGAGDSRNFSSAQHMATTSEAEEVDIDA